MVSTRTQTGTLAPKHYDIATLTLQGGSPPTSPTIGKLRRSPKTKPTAASKPKSPITKRNAPTHKPKPPTAKPRTKSQKPPSKPPTNSLNFDPKVPSFQEQMALNYLPTQMVDICNGINFFPSRHWGEKEEIGLSAIQRAERDVEIWEEVKRSHAQGGLEGMVPLIEAVIEGEREKMAELKRREREGEEGLGRAGEENPGEVAIKERLETLEWALRKSKYEPEAENIRGAIAGYKSGTIKYSKHFTLIYAGKIVDTAPTYSSFVADRQERLNRYFALHGSHWLWWEPPLDVHPESKPKMMGSLPLPRSDEWTALGQWYIIQGFWKRSGWVNRVPEAAKTSISPMDPYFWKATDGRVFCQEAGPKQAFRSLLDSGATYPSLYTADFQKLLIDEQNYACQSVASCNTANGTVNARLFELFVCVLDNEQKQLVDENHSAWPYHAKYLGGLCPVVEVSVAPSYDEQGREQTLRLSGMLPFVACYLSSTPTRSTLFLGEDRKDVLGSHRVPGQRKWDIAMPAGPPIPSITWERYQDPKTTFSHREGRIIDEDDPNVDFASTVTFMRGTTQEYSHRIYPKEEIETSRVNLVRQKAAQTIADILAMREQQQMKMGGGQSGAGPSTTLFPSTNTGQLGASVPSTSYSGQPTISWMKPGQKGDGTQGQANVTTGQDSPDPEAFALSPEPDDSMDTRDGGIERRSRRRVRARV